MITLTEKLDLGPCNTFGISVSASRFVTWDQPGELKQWIIDNLKAEEKVLPLGGGSNILFTKDFDGWVLKSEDRSIHTLGKHGDKILVEVGAGLEWDLFVVWSIGQGLFGLENLSGIPGTVGASPIQNIGAYGVEAGSMIEEVKGILLSDGSSFTLPKAACSFGYRSSIFKAPESSRMIITRVVFGFRDTWTPNIQYKDLQAEMGVSTNPSAIEIREAILRIRGRKLPDPAVLGNAGSFFKNPEIPEAHFLKLQEAFPTLTGYPGQGEGIKIAAAWLIEQTGWKGYRKGDAGTCKTQPLVLVNHGHASGMEILRLADEIEKSVHDRFGIRLEREVRVI